MRLLLIGPNSIHLRNFRAQVARSGHDVQVLTQFAAQDFFAELPPERIRRIRFQLRSPWRLLAGVLTVRSLIRTFRPDVIHAHQLNVYSLTATLGALGMQVPLVVTGWGSDVLAGPAHSAALRLLVRFVLRRASGVIAESSILIARMRELEPGAHATYHKIHFGTAIGSPRGLPREAMVYSNRLHKKNYNLDKVLAFFAGWRRLNASQLWRLVVAGSGELTGQIRAQAEALGIADCTEFVGWVDAETNRSWCERASLFISIPDQDSISISLLEAMAAGCIPVVSDIPSNHELILEGVNGVYLGEPASVQQRIAGLDRDLLQRLNRRIVQDLADPEACRQAVDAVYRSVLAPAVPRSGG